MQLAITMAAGRAPVISSEDLDEVIALRAEAAQLRTQTAAQAKSMRALRLANDALKSRIAGEHPQEPKEIDRVWALSDLGEWAAENADRITILPRAISESKKSDYANPTLFYKCLELLAETYRLVKTGALARDILKREADELGLDIGGSVDQSRAGMAGEEYFVRFAGRRMFLDQHLAAGSSRESRYCLRIYYFWDANSQRVVVGSCPKHLSNRYT